MFATELLGALGLGQQLVLSGTLILVALYVWRAAAIAKLIGALVGTVVGYVVLLFVVLALGVAIGWIDLYPSAIMDGVSEAMSAFSEIFKSGVIRTFDSITSL